MVGLQGDGQDVDRQALVGAISNGFPDLGCRVPMTSGAGIVDDPGKLVGISVDQGAARSGRRESESFFRLGFTFVEARAGLVY
jgi:hypothetical protein